MTKFLSFILLVLFISGCADIYTAPKFDRVKKSHHKVALLPFDTEVELRPKDRQKITEEELEGMEKEIGFAMQQEIYRYLLKRLGKDKLTVDFVDVDRINRILQENNIAYKDIFTQDKTYLAELFDVEAILGGKIYTEKPMSTEAAVALGVLFGAWGSTNEVDAIVTIHEGKTGDLLWRYQDTYSGSVGSTPENLAQEVMRKVSKKFPYKK